MFIKSFRPQCFSELVGEELNSKLLLSVARNRRLGPSTFIFSGEFGSGKSSSSRLFAKILNCRNPKPNDICGKCDVCTSNILETPFYSEYDSSAMGNVESVRELRDSFFFKVKDYTRVINLDECLSYNSEILCRKDGEEQRLRIVDIVQGRLDVEVLSYNFTIHECEWKRVIGWHRNQPKQMSTHRFLLECQGGYKEIRLTVTDNHVLFRDCGEEVFVSKLREGDRVIAASNNGRCHVVYAGVCPEVPSLEDIYCYDLTVEDNHNYIANDILVHNCHLLSRQAQSALLKVFEETSEGVYFVLSTTDPEKLLPTIRSRSLVLNFGLKSKDLIVRNIKELSDRYSLNLSDRVIEMIAVRSKGHMRDAHMLVDKCMLLGEDDFISTDQSAYNFFVKYVASIFLKDKTGLFSSIEQILRIPVAHSRDDWQNFLLDLMRASIDSESDLVPQMRKLSTLLGNRVTSFVRLAMGDWVLRSFDSDVQLQTCLLAIYQIVTKEFN